MMARGGGKSRRKEKRSRRSGGAVRWLRGWVEDLDLQMCNYIRTLS